MKNLGITFEHGWLLVNGVIVECTLDHLCPEYFPAKDYNLKEAGRLMRANRHKGIPLTGYPGMVDMDAWAEAHVQAMASAMKLPVAEVRKFLRVKEPNHSPV